MEIGRRLARPISEVAQGLTVSTDSLRRAVTRGELRVIRVGRRLLIPEDEVVRIVREGLGPYARKPAKQ